MFDSELIRLLGTAKDEDRKDVIRKAISALESTHNESTGLLLTFYYLLTLLRFSFSLLVKSMILCIFLSV